MEYTDELEEGDLVKLVDRNNIILRIVEMTGPRITVRFVEDKNNTGKESHQLYSTLQKGMVIKLEPEEMI